MYIESVAIESFGSYKNFSCSFDSGVNIIEGPNEAGKTTLGAFIKFIFYGLGRKAGQNSALSEARRFRSWENDIAAGSLTFVSNGKRYRIERSLRPAAKVNSGETLKIIDLSNGSECFKGEHPGRLFFGVEEDAFAQSAYVGQADGGKVNGKTVSAAIENMLFSGDETVSTTAAQKKLDDARAILKYKVRRGGKIHDLEDRLEALLRRRETARSDNKVLIAKESEKKELTKRFEIEKDELSKLEKQILRATEREKLARFEYYDRLCEVASEKSREKAEFLEKTANGEFLPSEQYAHRLETLDTTLGYLDTQAKQNDDDIAALGDGKMTSGDRAFIKKVNEDGGIEALKAGAANHLARRKKNFTFGMILCIIGVIALAFAIYSFVTAGSTGPALAALGVSIALLAVSVLMAVYSFSHLGKYRDILERYGVLSIEEIDERFTASSRREYLQSVDDEKMNSFSEKRKKIDAETEKAEGEARELLEKWGRQYSSRESVRKTAREAREAIKALSELAAEESKAQSARDAFVTTLDGYDREQIVKFLDESRECGDIEEGKETAYKLDFDRRSVENGELGDEIRLIELDIARLSATAEDPTLLSDEISRLTAEKEQYEICHDAYMLAHTTISAAVEKLRTEVSPRLAMYASNIMSRQTGGKYGQLGVDENLSLAFGVDSSGIGNIVTREIDYLSEGTKDLAYVSLRLALVALLFSKDKPPMIFDESFARLDDKRLENTFGVLDEVAKGGIQIFIFTSQTRDAKIMEKVGKAKYIML